MTNLAVQTPDLISDIPKRGMPVTIITGFLGSGKTTFLNQIIKNRQDLQVAVLVNEFGDINIDAQLLISTEDDMVELSNGCICCTINEGLVDAVYRVLEREDRIDCTVIETTGVADPLPIILTFVGTELRGLTLLDSVLTVVDSETFTPDHFDSEAAFKQVALADIVLLNKTDLAPEKKVSELEAYIRTVKEGARILPSQHGEVPLPLILGVELTSAEAFNNLETEEKHEHHNDREHHHHHGHHSRHLDNDGFVSLSFESDRPFDVHKFQEFLTDRMPFDVFRAKGILWFQDSPMRHIFQLSGPRYELDAGEWSSTPKNQLAVMGRNLDTDGIRERLNSCLV
ncbi:GTP-binding protein [Microcoleus sp. ARI1-B5]|uniref:CobW family GTP-binding protein n=1 Tax=unclassified Microcoleus TaxID=2642155 RepID=UPI002FD33A22